MEERGEEKETDDDAFNERFAFGDLCRNFILS